MEISEAIIGFLGQIVAYGGGGAVVAFGIYRFLGEKWIEGKFSERLENLRHTHEADLARLQLQIDGQLSRVTKLHEKEFVVVPEAWSKMKDAQFEVQYFVSLFQSSPDLDRMSPARLEECLAESKLLESEKATIRATDKKTNTYAELAFWHDLSHTREIYRIFRRYIEKNSVFMSDDIRQAFTKIDGMMWDVLLKREIGTKDGERTMWVEASGQLREELLPAVEALEKVIQSRLHATG